MSHDFKNRLNDYLSSDPTKKDDETLKSDAYSESGVRNVRFVLLDGQHIFLNYNYLVAGEFFSEDKKIVLHFTTHIITLQGYNLERLYLDLMMHLPKTIIAINDRYSSLTTSPTVTEIHISQ